MKPLVLNAWAQASAKESRVCLESTFAPSSVEVAKPVRLAGGDYSVGVCLSGVGLAMAPDDILVADGLIRKIVVLGESVSAGDKPARLDVILEHSAEPVVSVIHGMPVRVELSFPRDALSQVFAGKVIAVDPGHGGRDAGIRGPVNLLEKNAALDVAMLLQKMLSECDAMTLMSRDRDCTVDPRGWAIALSASQPALLVEIHVSGEKDPMSRSYHVFARRGSDEAMGAAQKIAGALTERMGTAFPEIETMEFAAIPLWPAVRVEPVCLTHFVDEANFRAPLFRKRIAQAIFNGISRYLSASSRGGIARVG